MLRLIARRIVAIVPLFVLVTIIVFTLVHLAPGDPARVVAGGENATPEDVEAARIRLGLDKPVLEQYWNWLCGLLHGDFGHSFTSGQSVGVAILNHVPVTASLTIGAAILAVVFALPLGIVAAYRPNGIADRLILLVTGTGVALPGFFVGVLLVLFLAIKFRVFPATGYAPLADGFGVWISHLVLPCVTLAVAVGSELARYVRATMLDELNKDYVRTARAKGLSSLKVVGKHALKNAAVPIVTVFGLQIRFLLGGTIVVEQIFGLNGLGALAVQSAFDRDFPVVEGLAVATALAILFVNLAVDISYGYFSPRLRASV